MKIYVGAADRRETDLEKLRVPMPPRVEIVVQDFVGFISEFASNISAGGMFVGTESPHSPGTEIEFDIHLAEDNFALIRGRGTVVWVRTASAGERRPAGMGIRFSSLEGDSLAFIQRIVDNFVAEGGTPFELAREAPEGAPVSRSPGPAPIAGQSVAELAARGPAGQASPLESREASRDSANADSESLGTVRALGHSDRGFAPGMEPAQGLVGQDERTRAPKPRIPGIGADGIPSDPGSVREAGAGQPPVPSVVRGPIQPSSLLEAAAEIAAAQPGSAPTLPTAEPRPEPALEVGEVVAGEEPPLELDLGAELSLELDEASEGEPSAVEVEEVAASEEPPLELDLGAELSLELDEASEGESPVLEADPSSAISLDLDDEDFSIEFDTTNSLESETVAPQEETVPPPGEPPQGDTPPSIGEIPPPLEETVAPIAAVSREAAAEPDAGLSLEGTLVEDEPTSVPDLSETLGQGMVGAGTGFFEAVRNEPEVADVSAFESSDAPAPLGMDVAGLEGVDVSPLEGVDGSTSEFDDPAVAAEVEDTVPVGAPEEVSAEPEEGDPTSLEELVAELRSETVEGVAEEEARMELVAAELELEAMSSLDVELLEDQEDQEIQPRIDQPGEGVENRPTVEPPPANRLVFSEFEPAKAFETRSGKRRRSGQLRRWSILLLLLGGLGGGVYYVREKGVELFLGPGSDFVLVAEPLAESEELAEIEPSTLLELLQQEKPQVEIEELEGSRQRQARPLSLIENVTWQESERTTILTLWANGDFTPSSTAYVRLDGETSREVLQIRGAEEPYWASSLAIDTQAVEGLRFGYKVRKPFNEVHLAIDLQRSQARVRRIELDGRRLHVYVR